MIPQVLVSAGPIRQMSPQVIGKLQHLRPGLRSVLQVTDGTGHMKVAAELEMLAGTGDPEDCQGAVDRLIREIDRLIPELHKMLKVA